MSILRDVTLRDERDEEPDDDGAHALGEQRQSAVSAAFLDFERRRGAEGETAQLYFDHGMRLLELGTGAGVEGHTIEALRRCTELDPRNASAFYHLGLALMSAQKYEDALAAYQRADELAQNSPDVLMGLIYAHAALDNFALSNAWIERLFDICKREAEGVVLDARVFYCWYGVTLVLADRPGDAESFFVLAQTASGEPSSFADAAHYGLGACALWRGGREGAARELSAITNRGGILYRSLARAVESGGLSKEEFLKTVIGRKDDPAV